MGSSPRTKMYFLGVLYGENKQKMRKLWNFEAP